MPWYDPIGESFGRAFNETKDLVTETKEEIERKTEHMQYLKQKNIMMGRDYYEKKNLVEEKAKSSSKKKNTIIPQFNVPTRNNDREIASIFMISFIGLIFAMMK